MTKNPYLNAIFAGLYIVFIVLVMTTFVDNPTVENSKYSLLIPMTVLSLFVFSAALMGYLFAYTPITMYLDNKKQEALVFFGKTLGAFAVCAFVLLSLLWTLTQ